MLFQCDNSTFVWVKDLNSFSTANVFQHLLSVYLFANLSMYSLNFYMCSSRNKPGKRRNKSWNKCNIYGIKQRTQMKLRLYQQPPCNHHVFWCHIHVKISSTDESPWEKALNIVSQPLRGTLQFWFCFCLRGPFSHLMFFFYITVCKK